MIKAKAHVSNVVVSIHVPPPLTVNESSFTFNTISPNTPCEISATFYIKDNYLPSDLVAKATATYQNMAGAPRVSQTTFRLPAKLVIKACAPIKNANYKVTIDTNKPPVNLNDLFPDLLGDYADGPGNALGFQYYGGPVVTMLASKTSQRYRLQCDSFEPMWLLANELVNRLSGYFKGKNQDGFQASFSGALPLHEYFEVLEQHFEVRSNQNKYKDLLAQRASQFRAIQRRLLTRFKDKTPTPLSNLDTLLDGTYRQLLALADAAEENVRNLARVSSSLSAATYLLNLLILLWTNMSDKEFYVLQSSLCPQVNDSEDQGWEEMVDCAITHLLRTCLAKNSKDQAINPSPLTPPKDTQKLKKHIALLCDKLSKGAKLVIEGLPQDIDTSLPGPAPILQADKNLPRKKKTQPMLSDDIVDDGTNLGEAAVPIGSKFGEIKSPRNKKPKKKKPAEEEEVSPLAGPSDGLLDLGNLPPIPGGNRLGDGFRELQKQQKIRNNVPDLDDLNSEQPPPYQSSPPPYEDENTLINGSGHGTGEKLYSL
ncbi:protein PTHB1-like [Lineus longissimus]|uniref:protein PTHB1-like n=1 Tax=Lineus longissimus TaxID=88925 RepID=UPI00315D5546